MTQLRMTNRRNDIDWLRILATGTVFMYHCARYFDPWGWHVKNNHISGGVGVFVNVVSQWIMPLFFILSAIAAYHALSSRNNRQFVLERTLRLAVPFVFGTLFFLIPVQVYIERLSHGDFSGSFWAFYPHYFHGWYSFGGNFAWMGLHLWYLEMLFIFSLMMLPVLRLLKRPSAKAWLDRTLAGKPLTLTFAIPVIAMGAMEVLVNQHPETYGQRGFGGWSPATYLVIFLLGYILCTRHEFIDLVWRWRRRCLLAGIVITTAGYYLATSGVSTFSPAFSLLRGLNTWCWICAILGFGAEHLYFHTSWLPRISRAVIPFYILHQTVIVIIGYWMRSSYLIVPVKFFLLATSSFLIIALIYAMVIRPVKFLQFLMGMKKTKPEPREQATSGNQANLPSPRDRSLPETCEPCYGTDA